MPHLMKGTEMTYQTEFPDFDPASMPIIPDGFTDRSWKNEACPCFIHEATGIVLWVDFADPEQREFSEMSRFTVQRCSTYVDGIRWQFDGGNIDLFEHDDWEVIARSLPNFMTKKA